jgi:trk system potassium uptake protein TrkH
VNIRSVLHILGWLSLLLGLLLLIPFIIALFHGDLFRAESLAFLFSSLIAGVLGWVLKSRFRIDLSDFGICEGFASVTFGWILITVLGALPYLFSGVCGNVVDAFFETMSGITTTGATIMTNVEALPPSILFWRSFTHWLGGMGIVALSVAVLPVLGAGGNMLFRAEVPGPTKDKLAPRIAQAAKILWIIYAFLTFAETGILWSLGMPLLDSFCHAFGTLATGGFSTKNASIGYYGPAVQWVVIVFMFLAGVNFVLYFQLINGRLRQIFRNSEFRLYVGILLAAVVVIALFLYFAPSDAYNDVAGTSKEEGGYDSAGKVFRDSVFQSVSIMTTTGYCTADFDVWPHVCRFLLVVLMVFGACGGSTGGGMKVMRVLLAVKIALREIRRLVRPRAVFSVKVEGSTIPEEVISSTAGFFILYFLIFGVCSIIMHLLGLDLETAFSSVIACLSNIGPGLAGVGAVENYADIPILGKIILSFCMLLGRLEFYSVLILFVPLTWKR